MSSVFSDSLMSSGGGGNIENINSEEGASGELVSPG